VAFLFAYLTAARDVHETPHKDLRPQRVGDHASRIKAVSISPDGTTIATAEFSSSQVALWSTTTGKLLRRLEVKGEVWDVEFSPNGSAIAVALGPRGYVVVELDSMTRGREVSTPGHVAAVQFSPNGDLLAIPINNVVSVWDLNGLNHKTFSGHRGTVGWIVFAFTDRRKTLISASEDGVVRWWDWDSEKKRGAVRLFDPHVGLTGLVKIDNERIACCSQGGTVAIVGITTRSVSRIDLHEPITALSNTHDSVVASTAKGTVFIVNTKNHSTAKLRMRHPVSCLSVRKDIAVVGYGTQFYHLFPDANKGLVELVQISAGNGMP
jgi:WD40 repeat protein